MNYYRFIAIACFILSFMGCDSEGGTQAVIYPLSIGNRWVYEHIAYDTSATPYEVSTNTVEVLDDTLIGSEIWYFLGYNGIIDSYSIRRNKIDGLYYWPGFPDSTWLRRSLKYPAAIGDVCSELRDTTGYNIHSIRYVINVDTLVTTPAGIFRCLSYRTDVIALYNKDTAYSDISYTYASPNVGMVTSLEYFSLSNGPYVLTKATLQSYSVKRD